MHFAGSAHLLQQHAKDILVFQRFVGIIDDNVKTKGFRTCTNDVQRLRMHVSRDEEAICVLQLAHTLGHRHRFRGGGRFIQQGSRSHIKTGQIQRDLLEIKQRFKAALRHFRLIRSISGVPARVFQHIAQDNRRQLHRGVTHANIRLKALVATRNRLQLRQRGEFCGGLAYLRRRGKLDIFRHDLFNQCVE